MQDSTPTFDAAIAAHRTWSIPRLRTDWEGTGYAGDGSLDDLSGQMGEEWGVDHTLDDGYPDVVAFVSGTSVPQLDIDLTGRTSPSPVPVSTTSTWTDSTANAVGTGTTATLTVPAGLIPGDWLFMVLSINASTATIACNKSDDEFPVLAGPTADAAVMQTVVYGCPVNQDIADSGGTYTFTWSTAANYTLVGASVGARDAGGRRCVMQFVGADQTNEALAAQTNHTTPTVVSSAARNVVVTMWSRGTTQTATWAMAGTDAEAVEKVGASGASDNLDVAVGYGSTIEAAGSFARTGTTTSTSNATMAIVVLSVPTWEPMTATAWWSPLRTDSPVYGKDRDIPPVTFDVGVVTEAGQERVRVFTGQMTNTPVRQGEASLQTISAARLKLMKLVQLPAFAALYSGGLRATWPVSYCLSRCGIHPGPRPRDDTTWHVPMHGSAWAVIPEGNTVYTYEENQEGSSFPHWLMYEQTPADSSPVFIDEVDWIRGPYVSAPDVVLTADMRRSLYTTELRFDQTKPDAMSQQSSKGRFEFWVKGVATDVNNAPGGSATVSRLCSLWIMADDVAQPYARMGISPTRNLQVEVWDGVVARTLNSAVTLPTDGEWYFCGVAYDMIADKLWMNFDGTLSSTTGSMSTAVLPARDDWFAGHPVFSTTLPCAEITFTTGPEANVDNYPVWRDDPSFAPTATLQPSIIDLVALAETEPREAWQIISDYSKAELASVRFTETDQFEYLPLGWWVRDAQQVVVDGFDTRTNASKFDVDLDPTKIRNSVKVSYTGVEVVEYDINLGGFHAIYELSDSGPSVLIPPGVSVVKFVYGSPGIMPVQQVEICDDIITPLLYGSTCVTLNDVSDGSGTYATAAQVRVVFDAWDAGSATLRFTNMSTLTWYLANDVDEPGLRIVGIPIEETSTFVIDRDASSIAARGERAVDVSAPVIQTEEGARRLARNLKMSLRSAVATIGADQQGVEVTANPLRQPGDLVTFTDAETGVDDSLLWRLRGVRHTGRGADYRQGVVARRALPIMIIGEGRIGETLIGPDEA